MASLKILSGLALLTIFLIAYVSCNEKSNLQEGSGTDANMVKTQPSPSTDEVPYTVVEEMPLFPGGDEELLRFIAANTVYPKAALEKKIQGKVIVRFCVGSNGETSQATILKSVSKELDNEALRVVEKLPLFEPARQSGKAVPVWYMIPITFTLQ